MEPWILSDGTKVYLGGGVEGDSSLAEWVHAELQQAKTEAVNSHFGPSPHEEALEVSVPYLLDAFLRFNWDVVSAPEFETPKGYPRPDPPPGCVY